MPLTTRSSLPHRDLLNDEEPESLGQSPTAAATPLGFVISAPVTTAAEIISGRAVARRRDADERRGVRYSAATGAA